jgi:hypothetical protein
MQTCFFAISGVLRGRPLPKLKNRLKDLAQDDEIVKEF